MPTLIKNSNPSTSLCDHTSPDKVNNYNDFFSDNQSEKNGLKVHRTKSNVKSIADVKDKITDFKNKVTELPEKSPFKNLNVSMAVSVGDILNIIASEPDAKYIKIYNAFNLDDPKKRHTVYLVPADKNNEPYNNSDTTFAQDCCYCPNPPCPKTDILTQ